MLIKVIHGCCADFPAVLAIPRHLAGFLLPFPRGTDGSKSCSLQRRVRSELVPVEVWPTPSEPNWFSAAVYIAIAPPSTWTSKPVM